MLRRYVGPVGAFQEMLLEQPVVAEQEVWRGTGECNDACAFRLRALVWGWCEVRDCCGSAGNARRCAGKGVVEPQVRGRGPEGGGNRHRRERAVQGECKA